MAPAGLDLSLEEAALAYSGFTFEPAGRPQMSSCRSSKPPKGMEGAKAGETNREV